MQQIINVIDDTLSPQALLSLDELKALLKITTTDTDAVLQTIIDAWSEELATLANRVFGKAKVEESFFEMDYAKLLYFSRWPVKLADIETLTLNGNDILTSGGWVLEEAKGFLYCVNGAFCGTANAIYAGGYLLPDDAPNSLKQIAGLVMREGYYTWLLGSTAASLANVRSIQHKHARVMFFPPNQTIAGAEAASSPAIMRAVRSVLDHFIRHWV
jgi:hypothetical protein